MHLILIGYFITIINQETATRASHNFTIHIFIFDVPNLIYYDKTYCLKNYLEKNT